MPTDTDQPAAVELTAATLPTGTPCIYLRSAGDDIELFTVADGLAKAAGDLAALHTELALEGVATAIDPDTKRATIVAQVAGALVEFPDRQHDATGTILGTWREA